MPSNFSPHSGCAHKSEMTQEEVSETLANDWCRLIWRAAAGHRQANTQTRNIQTRSRAYTCLYLSAVGTGFLALGWPNLAAHLASPFLSSVETGKVVGWVSVSARSPVFRVWRTLPSKERGLYLVFGPSLCWVLCCIPFAELSLVPRCKLSVTLKLIKQKLRECTKRKENIVGCLDSSTGSWQGSEERSARSDRAQAPAR